MEISEHQRGVREVIPCPVQNRFNRRLQGARHRETDDGGPSLRPAATVDDRASTVRGSATVNIYSKPYDDPPPDQDRAHSKSSHEDRRHRGGSPS